jgi:lactonase
MPKSVVPLPPELKSLPTIEAKPWIQIESAPGIEGPSFDREGNFYIASPHAGTIFKITPQKQITPIFTDKAVIPDGTAFHKDGRLFIVCISGELLSMNSDGSNVKRMYPKYQGKTLTMNDLVFDAQGNMFVTDYCGSFTEPTGGVYRISTDGQKVEPVLLRLSKPNGVSLSPDGKVLWVGETDPNLVIRIQLSSDGTAAAARCAIAYYSTGSPGGPDSNKVDSEGNLYQCIVFQGRILVLNEHGIPVANVVVPGRDEGKHLGTSNLAFKPGTNVGYMTVDSVILANTLKEGAWIYQFQGLAKGLPLYSHQ